MGVLIDTGVLIRWERDRRQTHFDKWKSHGDAAISVITASELLVGVHRANTSKRRLAREKFVEGVLSVLPILDITLGIARIHSETMVKLSTRGLMIGPHDLWIAATALHFKWAVLTTNPGEFDRVDDLNVLDFDAN